MGLAVQMLLLSVLTNTAAQLSLKHGLKHVHVTGFSHPATGPSVFIRLLKNPFVLLWAGLLAPSMLLWLRAISMVDLSFAYPFMSLNLVFISIGSVWFLRERIRAKQWAGIFFVVFGLILISIS
jgi:drug/metabolite transporter (DMT)-like permease